MNDLEIIDFLVKDEHFNTMVDVSNNTIQVGTNINVTKWDKEFFEKIVKNFKDREYFLDDRIFWVKRKGYENK